MMSDRGSVEGPRRCPSSCSILFFFHSDAEQPLDVSFGPRPRSSPPETCIQGPLCARPKKTFEVATDTRSRRLSRESNWFSRGFFRPISLSVVVCTDMLKE